MNRLINESEGCKGRLTNRAAKIDSGKGSRPNRRVANEAFRRFLATIDTESTEATELMFGCTECERTLTSGELVKLGLDPVCHAGSKRLKCLVIDGTAAGILKKLPKFSDHTITISEGKASRQRLVSNRETKNAITFFIRLCRSSLQAYGRAPAEAHENFLVRDGKLLVRISAISSYGNGRKHGSAVMQKLLIIIRWMIEADCCLCDVDSGLRNHSLCDHVRRDIQSKAGMTAAKDIFSKLFSLLSADIVDRGGKN